MLHSFDVVMDDLLIQPEQSEKVSQKLVPARNVSGQRLTGGGENEAAIFLVFKQAFAVKTLHHVTDARLRDFETRRDVNHAGVSLRIDESEDTFEIILDRGGAASNGSGNGHGVEVKTILGIDQNKSICRLTYN